MNEHARFTVDLNALLQNFSTFERATEGETGAVVKGDAYGTGASRIAPQLSDAGCNHLFTGTLQEALIVRELVSGSVYTLTGAVDEEAMAAVREHNVTPVLYTTQQAALWIRSGGGDAAIHVDTGMKRLGIPVDEVSRIRTTGFEPSLLMTHLACADEPQHPLNALQLQRFNETRELFPNVKTSIGNSAGALNGEEFQGDITRPGIALYGGNPFAQQANPMKPVCTCYGRVLQKRRVPKGESIGYGASHIAPRDMELAIVGLGYADGISRLLSNRGCMAYEDHYLPIVGRVCMDLVHIDATEEPTLNTGDEVEFFGSTIPVDEVARVLGTISYEVLTSIAPRVPRQYI